MITVCGGDVDGGFVVCCCCYAYLRTIINLTWLEAFEMQQHQQPQNFFIFFLRNEIN